MLAPHGRLPVVPQLDLQHPGVQGLTIYLFLEQEMVPQGRECDSLFLGETSAEVSPDIVWPVTVDLEAHAYLISHRPRRP